MRTGKIGPGRIGLRRIGLRRIGPGERSRELSVGEVAARSGVAVFTVHF